MWISRKTFDSIIEGYKQQVTTLLDTLLAVQVAKEMPDSVLERVMANRIAHPPRPATKLQEPVEPASVFDQIDDRAFTASAGGDDPFQ